jgi:hypothetical protein
MSGIHEWDGSANVAKAHIERVSPAVRVERLLVEPVGPRCEERNTFISTVRLPSDGRIETVVCARVSFSSTTVPM